MYGSLLAVSSDEFAALAEGAGGGLAERLTRAHFDPDGVTTFSVDKLWQWVGATIAAVVDGAPAPWGPGGRLVVPDADPELTEALAELRSPEELLALGDRFGHDAIAAVVEGGGGYGPAVLVSVTEVASLATALEAVPTTQLRAAAREAVTDQQAYPGPPPDGEVDAAVDELVGVIESLRRFLRGAADRGDAVLYGVT